MLEQMGLSGLNSLLGNTAGQNSYNSQMNQLMNHSSVYNNHLLQQQYNQAMAQQKPQWVFNGVRCNSAREMANTIWPGDCAEKTHFLLKYE